MLECRKNNFGLINRWTRKEKVIMTESKKQKRKGIGCGVFLIIVGAGIFAERMGWFPFSMIWFLPAAFVAWGIAVIFNTLRDK